MASQALHDVLCGVLGSDHVYFNPPNGMQLTYPCFIYNYVNNADDYADNIRFRSYKRYSVTAIDEDPDSKLSEKLLQLPYCTIDRAFDTEGLSHFVHTLYYNGPRIKEEKDNG